MTNNCAIKKLEKEKEEWIHLYGSEGLQLGFIAGYSVHDGYKKERLELEHPGFVYVCIKHPKVDTPTLEMLNACSEYEGSYCFLVGNLPCIGIDNYLGDNLIIKKIITHDEFSKDRVANVLCKNKDNLYCVGKIVLASLTVFTMSALFLYLRYPTIFFPDANVPSHVEIPELEMFKARPIEDFHE